MSLRDQVLKGGVYLAVRESMGLVVSLGGVVLLTRLIGPTDYGLYAGSLGIVTVVSYLGKWGIDVCLVRREDAPAPAVYHQAFTLLLLLGGLLVVGGVGLTPLLSGWLLDARFVPPLCVLLSTVPVTLLATPATAQLERNLNYRAIAIMDLSGQITHYAVALPLAVLGGGVWAAVAGFWCYQLWLLVRAHTLAGYRPRLAWSRPMLRELLGYGLGYSGSSVGRQLPSLINPVIVGRFLGPEAVGYVAVAIRFAGTMSIFRTVSRRVSIAALAKVQEDRGRLRNALEEAMTLQVMAVAPLLAGFSLIATPVVPFVFGPKWASALEVYPLIALGMLVGAVFTMHASVLHVLQRNGVVALSTLVGVALFAVAAWLAVPRVGILGYGVGEVVAMGGYVIVHQRLSRLLRFSYAGVLPWLAVFIPPLFAVLLPLPVRPLLWLPVLLLALLPRQRHMLGSYLKYFARWRTA